jgi:mRNA interferase HigB
MRVIAVGTLRDFWNQPDRRDAEQPLRAWVHVVKAAAWNKPMDVKRMFMAADVVGQERVVFGIGGNKYRLLAAIHYRSKRVYVRFIGMPAEYDRIDARTV